MTSLMYNDENLNTCIQETSAGSPRTSSSSPVMPEMYIHLHVIIKVYCTRVLYHVCIIYESSQGLRLGYKSALAFSTPM